MTFFNLGNSAEFCSKVCKSFFFCIFCKLNIHICPFVVFSVGSSRKIFICFVQTAKLAEPHFCMVFFVVCSFSKNLRDFIKAFILCNLRKVCIFVTCLTFACKCRKQIFFCFCSSIFTHYFDPQRLCKLQYAYAATTSSPSTIAKVAFGASPGLRILR